MSENEQKVDRKNFRILTMFVQSMRNAKPGTIFTHKAIDDPIKVLYLGASATVNGMSGDEIRILVASKRPKAQVDAEVWATARERLAELNFEKRSNFTVPSKYIMDGLWDHLIRARCVIVQQEAMLKWTKEKTEKLRTGALPNSVAVHPILSEKGF